MHDMKRSVEAESKFGKERTRYIDATGLKCQAGVFEDRNFQSNLEERSAFHKKQAWYEGGKSNKAASATYIAVVEVGGNGDDMKDGQDREEMEERRETVGT